MYTLIGIVILIVLGGWFYTEYLKKKVREKELELIDLTKEKNNIATERDLLKNRIELQKKKEEVVRKEITENVKSIEEAQVGESFDINT